MAQSNDKYIKLFQRLRNVIDEVLLELGPETITTASVPRQRRDLKAERVTQFEINQVLGKWSKPAALRKKAK